MEAIVARMVGQTMRKAEIVRRELAETNPAAVLFDGMDSALVGWTPRFGGLAVYDRELCIRALVAQGMAWVDAEEFFEFNLEGAWMGEYTPVIVNGPRWGEEDGERWDGLG